MLARRAWTGLAVLCVVAVLASLELTVTHPALPAIDADLRPPGTQVLWIVDVYAFLLAGSMLTLGSVGDRIGRRDADAVGAVFTAPQRTLADPVVDVRLFRDAGFRRDGARRAGHRARDVRFRPVSPPG